MLTIDRTLAVGTVAVGNSLAWAQSAVAGDWSVAGVVAAISGIGFAVVGLITYGIRQIGAARIETQRAWDEAHKASLGAQIEQLTNSVATLRKSLHDSRNEAAAREERLRQAADELAERHAEEVERWSAEVNLMHETNTRLHQEVARLNARIAELTAATNSVRVATDSVRASLSGDQIPAPGSDEGPQL